MKVACYCEYCSAVLMYPSSAEGSDVRCTKCGVITRAKRDDEATKKARAHMKANRAPEPQPTPAPTPTIKTEPSAEPLKYYFPKSTPSFDDTTLGMILGRMIAHPFLSFFLLILILSMMFGGGGGGNSSSNPNEGYMSFEDDKLITTIAIKDGYGKQLSESEKNLLEAAKQGRLGKPYEQRPDKSR